MTQPEEDKRADGAHDVPKPGSRPRGRSRKYRERPSDDSKERDQRSTQPARGRRRRRHSERRPYRLKRDAEDGAETPRNAEEAAISDGAETPRNAEEAAISDGSEEESRQDEEGQASRAGCGIGEDAQECEQGSVSGDGASEAEPELVSVVGVKFRKSGKVYYFAPNRIELSPGDAVIVETARGVEFGSVVCGPKQIPTADVVSPLKPVVRKATVDDQEKARENEEKEKQALDICLEKIARHDLPMKLVDVEYTFDRNKLVFYFTSDGRVDFRELVKDLASVFRTRIELRQIGVRDEAKMIGGLGCCGRPMCCASFLGDFEPVSIKMAKEQNLSLNPTKISGVCGRLMCCLRYEYEAYKACRHGLPKVGQEICTAKGPARVVDVDILRRLVRLDFGDGDQQVMPVAEISAGSGGRE